MAMLAEPRRKQRWTLNPRGKDWSSDSNKFGQRMLEKMGWTTGKGLGVNEQGMTEHVKIKVKNDTVGVGFKNDQDKAWTEHQKAFDNFLSHLQEDQDSNVIKKTETTNSMVNVQSLELKSKQSRARVHYQKFTRGKDVKKYSAKDLADILGGKNILNKESNTAEQEEKDVDVSNIENVTGGPLTINRGSITDYFKKKASQFLKDKDNNNTFSKDTSDSENEQYRGFGFVSKCSDTAKIKKSKLECKYTFDNPALDLHSTSDTIIAQDNIKSLKKRKGEFCSENDAQNLDHKQNFTKKIKIGTDLNSCKEGFINMALDLDNQVTEGHIRNKFEISRVQLGLTNDALDLTDETCDKKRVTFNDHVEYSTDSIKKKKCTSKLDKFEVDSKKKNRKKQKQIIKEDLSNKIAFINEALDINSISDESRDNETNEYKSKKHKKQKQQKISNLETIQEISEEVNMSSSKATDNVDKNLVETISKKEYIYVEGIHIKKKKKKARKQDTVAVNPDDAIVNMQADIEYTKKEEKSEKKGHKRRKINDCLEITKEVTENHQVIQENITDGKSTETLKIKKKRENKDINQDLEYKLKSRKSKKVQNYDEFNDKEINIVAQETINIEKHNAIDKSEISNEEMIVKAKIKNNIVSKEVNINSNKNDNSIVIETSRTDTEIRLQNVELPKINAEENTSNSIGTIADSLKEKTKVSKRMLRSFFHLNYVSDFPGSNINEIRGYGVDLI